MAITYTWDCGTVDTYTTHSDAQDPANTENDVIYTVHYTVSGTDTVDDVDYSASTIGTVSLSTEDLTTFTTFDSVTHEDLVTWTEQALGEERVNEIKNSISNSIADKIAPKTVTRRINP